MAPPSSAFNIVLSIMLEIYKGGDVLELREFSLLWAFLTFWRYFSTFSEPRVVFSKGTPEFCF
ncbi:unnamed protein product [Acanthoscelides obtectus]|uniref:Uncharacterized protein n=1 Tax=Acanthoscelides obtectus TaxID=200917 RepID=A0A9P0M246_ACAOB|nr:unnamed protein product [Acanthoscelides obtectus]CAK1623573.1 hypothetical protein AOBTE_LOCUS2077 [Acanthoscelides obtectus]